MQFRLDRTAFHASTHKETAKHHALNQPETIIERLQAVAYLNSVAFNYDLTNPPKLDRTAFAAHRHTN